MTRVVSRLKELSPSETFWYFSGRSSNEAGFLLQLFARLYGTNNVNNCSFYCHQASGVGLASVTGSGTATIVLDDLDRADVVFVIGGNPASNHPRLMAALMRLRRRGGEVVVINPVVETGLVNFAVPSDPRSLFFGSEIASLYVQPHIGGDLALLAGVAKRIREIGAADEVFLGDHCTGWPELSESLARMSWEELESKSGVTRTEIDDLADMYAAANNAVFAWTMGITHHVHGVQNVQAIANLALMRGMVGRPGAGLLPIRGHSNVQGIGSVGVTPQLKQTIFRKLEEHFGIELPVEPGLDTMGCVEAADQGRLALGVCLGGNLFGSNPDSAFAAESLSKLGMLVHLNTTLNTGHAHGLAAETLILPVLARDEEPQPTTQESMFNYVRLSDGGPRRHEGPRSEVAVISELANAVLGSDGAIDWRSMAETANIRRTIARIVPGFDAIGRIDSTKSEFQIDGRTFHRPRFATDDGRARIHVHDLPELAGGSGSLRLMTVRSEGQFNTVVYEDDDVYRGINGRDVVLLHPDDIRRLGLVAEIRVTVRAAVGMLDGVRVVAFDRIKPGNALMYYPEANVLVDRTVDPVSRTPAFKCTLVTFEIPR
jgi:molybdopterin-dependent oxidoreductase alpha subunit